MEEGASTDAPSDAEILRDLVVLPPQSLLHLPSALQFFRPLESSVSLISTVMTRYSNFGIKRKYVEATAQYRDDSEPEAGPSHVTPSMIEAEPVANDQPPTGPPKKKRKRGKSRKPAGDAEASQEGGGKDSEDACVGAAKDGAETGVGRKKANTKADKGKKKLKAKRGAWFLLYIVLRSACLSYCPSRYGCPQTCL